MISFDIKASRISELQAGHDHTLEVSEDELRQAKHLGFTTNLEDLRKAQIYIVTVPTPVDKANRPDLMPLIKASETVGRVLKSGDVVIYESTVYPGATEEVCVPILERESGLVGVGRGNLGRKKWGRKRNRSAARPVIATPRRLRLLGVTARQSTHARCLSTNKPLLSEASQ